VDDITLITLGLPFTVLGYVAKQRCYPPLPLSLRDRVIGY
jgi:hypothetical protein